MILQNYQYSPQQPITNPPSSQTTSQKTPSHLTIQQENQNHKHPSKPSRVKSRQSHKLSQDKKFRKLSKQSKKVKSLEEEYIQLQEEIREIKELVQLQVEMIDYSTQQINEKNQNAFNTPLHCTQAKQSFNQYPPLTVSHLQSCLQKLFSYHSTIETANSNYLLLSQVNKEQQSQQTFHIHNLEQRIRQLRFLLNGKQDLLAYETATFEGADNAEQDANDIRKICIDYHLPRRESLGNKNNMESEFRFVQKVVGELIKLKKNVHQLQHQLLLTFGNAKLIVEENPKQNLEKNSFREKDSIKQNVQDKPKQIGQRLAFPTKTARNKQPDNVKLFTQCQNTLMSAQTSRKPQKSTFASQSHTQKQTQHQLALLPLSIQNYKHSLIYRVGKLQSVQQKCTQKLQQKYQQLTRQLNQQLNTKRKLTKQYELKKDVYEYKKKLQMGKIVKDSSVTKNIGFCVQNILDGLDEHITEHQKAKTSCLQNSPSEKFQDCHENKEQPSQVEIPQLPNEVQTIKVQYDQSPKSLSAINLSSTSKNAQSILSPQKQLMFQELTNQQNTPNKKLNNSPFLKLKDTDSKRKHFSHQGDLNTKTPVRQRKVYEDGDKQNTPQKRLFNPKQNKIVTINDAAEQLDIMGITSTKDHIEKTANKQQQQLMIQNNRARPTLRKRRYNTKKNRNQNHQIQQTPIQTDVN